MYIISNKSPLVFNQFDKEKDKESYLFKQNNIQTNKGILLISIALLLIMIFIAIFKEKNKEKKQEKKVEFKGFGNENQQNLLNIDSSYFDQTQSQSISRIELNDLNKTTTNY